MIADRSLGLALGEQVKFGKDVYRVVGLTTGMSGIAGDGLAFFTVSDAMAIQFDAPAKRYAWNAPPASLVPEIRTSVVLNLCCWSALPDRPADFRTATAAGQRRTGNAKPKRGCRSNYRHAVDMARCHCLYRTATKRTAAFRHGGQSPGANSVCLACCSSSFPPSSSRSSCTH